MPTVRYTVVDGEVLAEKRNGTRRQYVPDLLGSTVALLDSSQAKTDTFAYRPYGQQQSRTGTTSTPFGYVGTLGYHKDPAHKAYVRARYLDSWLGRWITEDPIGHGPNLYGYGDASPARNVDPTGLLTIENCNKQQQLQIERALNHMCTRQQGYQNCISSGCCGQLADPDCFSTVCSTPPGSTPPGSTPPNNKNYVIRCGKCGKQDGRHVCGRGLLNNWADPRPGFIICDAAFIVGECGGLHCVLAHEFMHACGKTGHPQACFDCIDSVFPSCRGKVVDSGKRVD